MEVPAGRNSRVVFGSHLRIFWMNGVAVPAATPRGALEVVPALEFTPAMPRPFDELVVARSAGAEVDRRREISSSV